MSIPTILLYIVLAYWSLILGLFAAACLTGPARQRPAATTRLAKPPSYAHQITSFLARCLAFVGCLVLCSTYGVVVSVLLRCVGRGGLSQWTVARAFKYTMWIATGVWVDVVNDGRDWFLGRQAAGGNEGGEGGEWLERRPALFVGNHQTELDMLILGTMFPPYCSVTAKKSLVMVPFLGWFMYLSKTTFIDRKKRESALEAFARAGETMHSEKQSVYIFPEGTRSYADKPMLLPFKKGAFHLAVQAQVPIVPVVAANYSHILSLKQMHFCSGRIPVKVLEPFETTGLTKDDVDDLTTRVRDAMLKEIEALSVNGPAKESANGGAVASGVDRI